MNEGTDNSGANKELMKKLQADNPPRISTCVVCGKQKEHPTPSMGHFVIRKVGDEDVKIPARVVGKRRHAIEVEPSPEIPPTYICRKCRKKGRSMRR